MVGVTGSIPVLPTTSTLRYPHLIAGMAVRRFALYLSLCAGFAGAASAFAGVGTTSAGVTTTDPTNPAANVEQQSSGFVAANQRLQNGAAGGIALPAGVAGTAQPGQTGASNTTPGAAHDGSKIAAEHAAPPAPPPPPPPPPTYESRIKPVASAPVVAPATAPARPVASAAPVQKPVHAPEKPEAKPAPVPASNQNRVTSVEKKQDEPMPASTADPGGGRGAAPEGYTFWFGLLIAGALLALAAVTWLRIQRGETSG